MLTSVPLVTVPALRIVQMKMAPLHALASTGLGCQVTMCRVKVVVDGIYKTILL